jgi:acetyl-CoA carboxylase biotin carboxyl carrier protein
VRDASYGTATLEPFAASLGAAATDGAASTDDEPATAADGAAPGDEDGTLRVEVNDRLFRVRFVDLPLPRGVAASAARPLPKKGGAARKAGTAAGNDVVAPMHGVVVELPVPLGASVREGDVVAIIEAMKMMNEIEAEIGGKLVKIICENGQPVEYGQPLMIIEAG